MKIVLLIILVVLILLIAAFAYFGGFSKITIQNSSLGGEILVYENLTGAYNQAGKITDKVYYTLLNEYNIETTKGFSIFYDNPKHVEQSKLRSEIGCIVDNIDNQTLETLKENLLVKTLPAENRISAEFPFKGSFSIMLGLMKVYPAFEKYIAEHNLADGPVMEIYDVPNKKIIYRKFFGNNNVHRGEEIMYKSITPNLMVENVAETIAFYEGLGFAATATVPKESGGFQFAIMVKDNLMLMFQDRESLTGEYPILQTTKTQPSISLYIIVDDVNTYYDDMKNKYELQAELHKTFYGANEFAIKDNNGYILTFTENY
jgi:uncharacterized glyoxalase superfamily protein PhnB